MKPGIRSVAEGAALRIRILHTFFHPDKSAVSQILTDLAFHLAQQGHHVEVIASRGNYEGGQKLPRRETIQGVLIRRIWSPSWGKKSILSRLADLGSYAVGSTAKAFFSRRVDRVIVLTNPPMYALVARWLGLLRREPYTYIVMDLYPDISVQAGMLSPGSLLTRLARGLTRSALRHAHEVVVLGDCMAQAIRNYGVGPERIRVIQNWSDDENVLPLPPGENPLRAQLGFTDEFVVMYSGNMGVAHHFQDILQVARDLRGRKDIRFLFVGGGVRRRDVEAFRDEHQLDNVIVRGYFPRDQLTYSLPVGDAHFVSLREGFQGLVVPSKTYGAMAAGRPILYQGSQAGEIARMLREEGGGLVIPEGDPTALKEAILRWADDRQGAALVGRQARDVFSRHYTKAIGLRKYADLLRETRP
ncbi:MAG: glycosyltransferase family 4 protein [Planctomycetota bacterium]|nr:glycosyltransferase family 4 protein [Planctomycetota bacterium]